MANEPIFTNGKIGFTISTGASYPTEVWFDNVVVKTIDNSLDVPYFNQNDLPWGPTEYDHASTLNISSPTINRWGCAVTSAAMVLNFHNMTTFTDNTPIDPGSLNNWLKNNNGYLTGKNKKGGYAMLSFPTISRLTKILYDAGKATKKLEFQRLLPSTQATNTLLDDLNNGKYPDILKVSNASTSSHFVVATGSINNDTTFTIKDPEWNVADLSSFGNTYLHIDRFIPAQSNLSYLLIVTNPETELLITDPSGHKTGKIVQNGQTLSFLEISDALYMQDSAISNPGIPYGLGTDTHVFLLPKPMNGNYTLTISGNSTTDYTVNLQTFLTDGSNTIYKTKGSVSRNNPDVYTFSYSQTMQSTSQHQISLESTIADIQEQQTLGNINTFVAVSLLAELQDAQQAKKKGKVKNEITDISDAISILKLFRTGITDDGYTALNQDLQYLKTNP